MRRVIAFITAFLILCACAAPAFAQQTPGEESTTAEQLPNSSDETDETTGERTTEEPTTRPAVLPAPGSGDADADGKISAGDARLALRGAVCLEALPDYSFAAADVDRDGKVTAADARSIMRLAVGLPGNTEKYIPKTRYFTPALTEKDVPAGAKVIYLTFDDGPSANTEKILSVLDRYNVKATFFVIASNRYSYLYKEIVERGHSIALHSYSHEYSAVYRSTDAYFADLNRISDFVYEKAGVRTRLIRFPGGSSNTVSRSYCRGIMSALSRMTAEKGYVYFDWNSANNDATGQNLSVAQLGSAAKSYGGQTPLVMLMHDAAAKTKTAEALPGIIEYYKGLGYYFLPLNEKSPTARHGIAN